MELREKVAVVTASTRGIGLACVQALARQGALVYLSARNTARAQELAQSLCAQDLRVKTVFLDATQPETFSAMIDTVAAREGHLDVLVNNFGSSDPQQDLDFARTDPQVFLSTVELNLRSVFLTSQAAVRHMACQSSGGSIINISSVGGVVPDLSQVAYGTSKAAINYLTKLIAAQEAVHHIRCNAVLPGMTATDSVESRLSPQFRSLFLRHIPLGRMGTPEEMAAAVVYFASDASAYTTGQILTVSGGFGLASPLYADLSAHSSRR